jgi:hypothetical protein
MTSNNENTSSAATVAAAEAPPTLHFEDIEDTSPPSSPSLLVDCDVAGNGPSSPLVIRGQIYYGNEGASQELLEEEPKEEAVAVGGGAAAVGGGATYGITGGLKTAAHVLLEVQLEARAEEEEAAAAEVRADEKRRRREDIKPDSPRSPPPPYTERAEQEGKQKTGKRYIRKKQPVFICPACLKHLFNWSPHTCTAQSAIYMCAGMQMLADYLKEKVQ